MQRSTKIAGMTAFFKHVIPAILFSLSFVQTSTFDSKVSEQESEPAWPVRFFLLHRLSVEFADVSFKTALITPKVVRGLFEISGGNERTCP